jgi:hypothetical protein
MQKCEKCDQPASVLVSDGNNGDSNSKVSIYLCVTHYIEHKLTKQMVGK